MTKPESESSSVPIFEPRLRRPTPLDFQAMTTAQVTGYIRAIGFDEEVRIALAEYDRIRRDATTGDPSELA